MTNQCCCTGDNKNTNCVCCDIESYTNMTVTATVSGFTDNYCNASSHLNRTLVHSFNDTSLIVDLYNYKCKDTLIAGNASYTPKHTLDTCDFHCPPGGIHKNAGSKNSSDCPVDIDIGEVPIPAAVWKADSFFQKGIDNWACRCLDVCDEFQNNFYAAWKGPTCWLVIWYTVHFRCNKDQPSQSEVEYQVSFFTVTAQLRKITSQSDACDVPAIASCGGIHTEYSFAFTMLHFGGIKSYDADVLCTDIDITIPLCPGLTNTSGGIFPTISSIYKCDAEKKGNIERNICDFGEGIQTGHWHNLCGFPVNWESAEVNLTLNMS